MKGVLDTDILSYVLDERYEEVSATANQYRRVFRHFTVSAITVSEVVEGLESKRDLKGVQNFLRRLEGIEVLSLGIEEAILAGKIMAGLKVTGQMIGEQDPFIAAIAISHGLPLVTNNLRHYQRIQDLGFPLDLQNWRSA